MNLTNLRLLARAYVPGAKVAVVKNTTLDLILNQAVVDIASHTACLKTNKKFDVEADENEYSLSTELGDYLTMDKPGLWWNAGTGAAPNWLQLDPRTLKYFNENTPTWRDDDADDPLAYSIDGDILTIRPEPDTDLTDGFHIYYGKMPSSMTSGSHFPFTGSSIEYDHMTIFDDAILAFWEWKAQKIVNKGQDPYKATEKAYKEIREEKSLLFNRRLDIGADRQARFRGRRVGQ